MHPTFGLNPQPLPPGVYVNPLQLPPVIFLNPQPLPPAPPTPDGLRLFQ